MTSSTGSGRYREATEGGVSYVHVQSSERDATHWTLLRQRDAPDHYATYVQGKCSRVCKRTQGEPLHQ